MGVLNQYINTNRIYYLSSGWKGATPKQTKPFPADHRLT